MANSHCDMIVSRSASSFCERACQSESAVSPPISSDCCDACSDSPLLPTISALNIQHLGSWSISTMTTMTTGTSITVWQKQFHSEWTRKALRWGHTNEISNIFPPLTSNFNLWPCLTFKLYLDSVSHGEAASLTSRLNVIEFRSYCLDTLTHVHQTDCSTWTTSGR